MKAVRLRPGRSMHGVARAVLLGASLLLALSACGTPPPPSPPHATIYVISQAQTVYAINAYSRSVRWRYRAPGTSFVLDAGALYVASGNGELYALNAADGSVRWHYATRPQAYLRVWLVADGIVYATGNTSGDAGDATSYVYGLRVTDGALLLSMALHHIGLAGLTEAHGVLYLAEAAANAAPATTGVAAERVAGARPMWFVPMASSPSSAPVVADSTVYVATADNAVHALRAADGAAIWHRRVGSGAGLSPVTVSGGAVYVGDGAGSVYALDARDGAVRWQHYIATNTTATGQINYTISVVDGIVYPASPYNPTVYALKPSDGSELWHHDPGSYSLGQPPSVFNGVVYVYAALGTIDLIRERDGALIERLSFPCCDALSPIEMLAAGP